MISYGASRNCWVLARVFTTGAALSQIIKAWKTKEVNDVSPWMFIV
ncbi:hypothetical protein [Cellulophaga sp. Z1A5H]|nr:hypothetical protein [Cellulophaga sp. Z1A5H]